MLMISPLVAGVLIAMGGTVWAADPPGARYVVSPDGREILDVQARLAWRRCLEGTYWNGRTCAGTPLTLDHSQAMARAKAMATADQKPWRVPQVAQLRRLAEEMKSDTTSFALLFPTTPADWHWSVSVNINTAPVNPYNYGNVMQGVDGTSVNRISFMHGWAVNFGTGEARGDMPKRESLWVRLVRNQVP